MERGVLRGLALLGAAALAITELLSMFHLLRRGPLAAAWIVVGAAAVVAWRKAAGGKRRSPAPPASDKKRSPVPPAGDKKRSPALRPAVITGAIVLAIAAVVGYTAIIYPPNSADAMAYHMPRVVYWAQSGSIAFFPTPYFNQIMLPPLDEYFLLHAYVLSNGDRLSNLVAFDAFLGSIAGVWALAGALGLTKRGQALAALFAVTLPNFILQASGAKNDCLLTLWLVLLAYFVARRDVWFAGLALGLAVATKSTAYLFAPPVVAALWIWFRPPWKRMLVSCAAGVLLLNAPQYIRNIGLSGSPLGYDSAQGDGFFRWRNERLGWRPVVSNALRHLSEQLGARDPRWNQAVYRGVLWAHAALGLDPQDPDTTFRWSRYEAPRNANHEANANNRWHLLLAAVAVLAAALPGRRRWLVYAGGLAGAFLLFCFYLKWQPFLARLELPLFVLAAPLAGMLLERLKPWWLALPVCLFLVVNTRLPLLQNWTRPLRGQTLIGGKMTGGEKRPPVLRRDQAYFNDMGQWGNQDSYLESVDRVARSGCDTVGLDISENQLEYPFQALLRERNPRVWFVHTGVGNSSARYIGHDGKRPCAVLCLDCAGNPKKLARYAPLGEPESIGRFWLFGLADGHAH
ncbi:MAG TPA: hypothetical protein VML19_27360 [Verrucomicrobiae bacterium]|nr:hypothetical protein [Verrucomicrobiae bacterium]